MTKDVILPFQKLTFSYMTSILQKNLLDAQSIYNNFRQSAFGSKAWLSIKEQLFHSDISSEQAVDLILDYIEQFLEDFSPHLFTLYEEELILIVGNDLKINYEN